MGYLIAALFAAVILASGAASCEHKKVISLTASIEANNRIAASELEKIVTANKLKKEVDDLFAASLQKDYDDKLKEILARPGSVKYVTKLRDAGGQSGGCAQPGTTGHTSVSFQTATGCELSDAAGIFLRAAADRADSAATYAEECRKYAVKPKPTAPLTGNN